MNHAAFGDALVITHRQRCRVQKGQASARSVTGALEDRTQFSGRVVRSNSGDVSVTDLELVRILEQRHGTPRRVLARQVWLQALARLRQFAAGRCAVAVELDHARFNR
jgi:hypothetical protein